MKDSIINSISIVILIAVLILMSLFSNQFDKGLLPQIIGVSFVTIGVIIWFFGKKALGEYFSISITPKGLVTSGIYSKIRHPLYSGTVLIYLGIGLFLKSIIGLISTIILLVPLVVYLSIEEEKILLKKYGKKYLEYKKKTIF
jgi:protein-S-isoprenylcysteine O-methyltransferase Ste14